VWLVFCLWGKDTAGALTEPLRAVDKKPGQETDRSVGVVGKPAEIGKGKRAKFGSRREKNQNKQTSTGRKDDPSGGAKDLYIKKGGQKTTRQGGRRGELQLRPEDRHAGRSRGQIEAPRRGRS